MPIPILRNELASEEPAASDPDLLSDPDSLVADRLDLMSASLVSVGFRLPLEDELSDDDPRFFFFRLDFERRELGADFG